MQQAAQPCLRLDLHHLWGIVAAASERQEDLSCTSPDHPSAPHGDRVWRASRNFFAALACPAYRETLLLPLVGNKKVTIP